MAIVKTEEIDHRVEKWAAIAGIWQFTESGCRYVTPLEGQLTLPLGLARASSRFRDGTVTLQVKLARNKDTTAGVFLRFQSVEAPYVAAQIGAFNRAYSISEYIPGVGWVSRASAGLLSNLNVDVPHTMKVRIVGQSVSLTVDDVDVLRTAISLPLEGTGFGLYAYGDAPITFSSVDLTARPPKIFVIMPFSEPFDTLYRDVIGPVASRLDFEVIRVDEIVGPGMIVDDIQRQIESAHAVVAEISTQNPNVFYELGYAHALRKPAILLVRRSDSGTMPFDIRSYRAIFYDDSIGGKKKVERNLEQHLAAILRGSDEPELI